MIISLDAETFAGANKPGIPFITEEERPQILKEIEDFKRELLFLEKGIILQ